MGLAHLQEAGAVVAAYRRNGGAYEQALRNASGVARMRRRADAASGYWAYALRVERRPEVMARLHARGIGAQRLHLRCDRYACFAPAGRARRSGPPRA